MSFPQGLRIHPNAQVIVLVQTRTTRLVHYVNPMPTPMPLLAQELSLVPMRCSVCHRVRCICRRKR